MPPKPTPKGIHEKLLPRIIRSKGCWKWKGTISKFGYSTFKFKGKLYKVHRALYELEVRKVPKGKVLDNLCRNRACVSPSHLEEVTTRENVLRGNGHTALNARKTHCNHGHPLTKENIYDYRGMKGKEGWGRKCITCIRARGKEWIERKKLNSARSLPEETN